MRASSPADHLRRRRIASDHLSFARVPARRLMEEPSEKGARLAAPGWSESAPGCWHKEGCAYTVHTALPKKRWNAMEAPFMVAAPDGTPLGGSSHLWRAQQTAELLWQPIPDPPGEADEGNEEPDAAAPLPLVAAPPDPPTSDLLKDLAREVLSG